MGSGDTNNNKLPRQGSPSIQGRNDRQTGFTLLELLIALVIAALILGIGSPTFGEFRRNSRLTGAANDLLGAIQLARTEAVKQQRTVSLCPTADAGSEDAFCSDDPDFTQWIVFTDPDGNCERAVSEPLIRAQTMLGAGEAMRIAAVAQGTCLSFASSGFLREGAEPAADRILICDHFGIGERGGTNQSAARGIVVTPTGRVAITRDKNMIEAWGIPCPLGAS